MSLIRKMNRRRKYGNVIQRLKNIKESLQIEVPTIIHKPSSIFTYIPPTLQDDPKKST